MKTRSRNASFCIFVGAIAAGLFLGEGVANASDTFTLHLGGFDSSGQPSVTVPPRSNGSIAVDGPSGFWIYPMFHAHLGPAAPGGNAERAAFIAAYPFLYDVVPTNLNDYYANVSNNGLLPDLPLLQTDLDVYEQLRDQPLGAGADAVKKYFQPIVPPTGFAPTDSDRRFWSTDPTVWEQHGGAVNLDYWSGYHGCDDTTPSGNDGPDHIPGTEKRIIQLEKLLQKAMEDQGPKVGKTVAQVREFIRSTDYSYAQRHWNFRLTVQFLAVRGDAPVIDSDEAATDGLVGLDFGEMPDISITPADEVVFTKIIPGVPVDWTGPSSPGPYAGTASGGVTFPLSYVYTGFKLVWTDGAGLQRQTTLYYVSPGKWSIAIPGGATGLCHATSVFYPGYGVYPLHSVLPFMVLP